MSYLVATYLDVLVLLGLAGGALLAGLRLRGERDVRSTLLLVLVAVLLAAHGALVWRLSVQGWWFAQNAVLLGLPLVGVPALAVLVTVWRGSAALPLQALAVGAALAGVIVVVPPVPPLAGDAAVLFGVFAAAVLLLWWRSVHRMGQVVATAVGTAAALVLAAGAGWGAITSGTPERVTHQHDAHAAHGVSTSDLRETDLSGPVRRFTLTAAPAAVTLPSGERLDAWTFNGTVPGPPLDVVLGDLVEVTLVNSGIEAGVTLHWHGLDVPNAEDGVAGVTQDAVGVGERYTYRFRADQLGTYWYHSHQLSSEQVRKGLYGAIVVRPPAPAAGPDLTLLAHSWAGGVRTLGAADGVTSHQVPAGAPVRVRLVNTDSTPATFGVAGTDFRVVAIDGHDLTGPTPLSGTTLRIGAGGRYDVEFVQPPHPVRVGQPGDPTSAVFGPDPALGAPEVTEGPVLDPTAYGTPTAPPFDPADADRRFVLLIDQRPGFFQHRPTRVWAVNGLRFPDVPSFVVAEGDVVRMTVVNRGPDDHPMHLHGHHVTVLSRNGHPATGSRLWLDTVNVAPGEQWEVAFRADNPGIWMDHCHNLDHAANGMVVHLSYEGVTSPFEVGTDSGNLPE